MKRINELEDDELNCPGCTCDGGKECGVYLEFGKVHWFILERADDTVECEFCGMVVIDEAN